MSDEKGTHKKNVMLVIQNVNDAHQQSLTYGDRLADRVANIGGSWKFIIAAILFLICWAAVNTLIPFLTFDPYPFIFLNLTLSMLAALQAPIIMMSQNRQSEKDRMTAQLDYDVNCKTENEIFQLGERLDQQVAELNHKLDTLLKTYNNILSTNHHQD